MFELSTATNGQVIGVMPEKRANGRFSINYRIGQVMQVLAYHDYGITAGDIAKNIGISPQYTRKILTEMGRRKLITGIEAPHRPGWIKFLIYPAKGEHDVKKSS